MEDKIIEITLEPPRQSRKQHAFFNLIRKACEELNLDILQTRTRTGDMGSDSYLDIFSHGISIGKNKVKDLPEKIQTFRRLSGDNPETVVNYGSIKNLIEFKITVDVTNFVSTPTNNKGNEIKRNIIKQINNQLVT